MYNIHHVQGLCAFCHLLVQPVNPKSQTHAQDVAQMKPDPPSVGGGASTPD